MRPPEHYNSPEKTRDLSHIHNPEVAHEPQDVNVRGILIFGAALLVSAVVINLVLWWMLKYFAVHENKMEPKPHPLASERQQLPPEPRLQGMPGHEATAPADMQIFSTREEDVLNSYGWVDQKAGVVRIPIQQAKKLLLEKGLSVRSQDGGRRQADGVSRQGARNEEAQTKPGEEKGPAGKSAGRTSEDKRK
jgi:hypothetical protein